MPRHLLVTVAHTTSQDSSRDESKHLLKILIAIQTTAVIPFEDGTHFLAWLFLASLLNSHVSRFIFFSPTNLQLYPEAFHFRAGYNNKDSRSLSAFALLLKW